MKKALFALLVLCVPALLAQEAPTAQNRPEQPPVVEPRSQATPAPQLGHPLDPADVDVLTGKNKAQTTPAYRVDPYAYAAYSGYPANVAPWGPSRLARIPSSSLFLAGRAGNRSFFVIGNTGGFVPPLFLFGLGRGIGTGFFFAPVRPGFFFFRR